MDPSSSQLPPQEVWDSLQAISRSLEELKQRLGSLEQSVHVTPQRLEPQEAVPEVGEILTDEQWEALGPQRAAARQSGQRPQRSRTR